MKRRNFLKTSAACLGCSMFKFFPPVSAQEIELKLHPASFWSADENLIVNCELCPNRCRIGANHRGRCKARLNKDGQLFSLVYGNLSTIAVDPIEKKPVFHVLPGSFSLSVSAAGCVLSCRYCQNWQISQATPEEVCNIQITPQQLVEKAIELDCKSISYTYNEPTVFYEFMYDTAVLAQKKGLRNIMVSCGYINEKPLQNIMEVMDVIKVDLKGFTEEFYQNVTKGHLEPVKSTISTLAKAGKLMDIVCLIVPGLNDDEKVCNEMFKWLFETSGPDISLFLSRFHPTYQIRNISPTPVSVLEKLRKLAINAGINYVYLGNVPGHEAENTYCPKCGQMLIQRFGYQVRENRLKDGHCFKCNKEIKGIWI
ncbi:MAG: AmmeMemoRadiSam system radical SAM enzyme [Candidatus Rifleibacteriota bacterium]